MKFHRGQRVTESEVLASVRRKVDFAGCDVVRLYEQWLATRDAWIEKKLRSLGVMVDAFPPTIFNTTIPVAWVPTVELTAHVRARPAPGWLRCSFRTRFVTGGFLEEDGEVWDAGGTLVAQSRQLALVPRPE